MRQVVAVDGSHTGLEDPIRSATHGSTSRNQGNGTNLTALLSLLFFARKYDRCVLVCLFGNGKGGRWIGGEGGARRGRRQPLLYDVSIIEGGGAFFVSSFLAGEKGGTKAGDLKLTVSRGSFSPTLKLLVGSAWCRWGVVWRGGGVCVCGGNRRVDGLR